jgi:DNA-binding response OmpR family regulator
VEYFELTVRDKPVGIMTEAELEKLKSELERVLVCARRLWEGPPGKAVSVYTASEIMSRLFEPDERQRVIKVQGFTVDGLALEVRDASDLVIPLSTLEFKVFYHLACHPDIVFSRQRLLDAAWGLGRFVTIRIVDVYMRRLREKLEEDPNEPKFLLTKRGEGYMLRTAGNVKVYHRQPKQFPHRQTVEVVQ